MIYITGDCHGNMEKLSTKNFPEQKNMTKNDFVIICGDFGLVWDYRGENNQEKWWLDWLESKPFTTLFVDGNHENFERLNQDYPVEEWNGGTVHKIRPSVIHLMRGQVFELNGLKVFTFGGAASHDIRDGILEPDAPDFEEKYYRMNRNPFCLFRVNHMSWWKEELPSLEEMEEGRRNLAKHDNKVDLIVTHDCPGRMYPKIGHRKYQPNVLTDYLTEIQITTEHRMWYCGHHHVDQFVDLRFEVLYDDIEEVCV